MMFLKVTTLRDFFSGSRWDHRKMIILEGQFANSFTFRMRTNAPSKRQDEEKCAEVIFWSRSRHCTSMGQKLSYNVFLKTRTFESAVHVCKNRLSVSLQKNPPGLAPHLGNKGKIDFRFTCKSAAS